jgi:hypothetical protein
MMTRSILVVMTLAGVAHADKASSIEHYNKGRKAYAAASFEQAVAEFERAYREFPAPEYLHDIGQAFRRLEKCDALDYFDRYLAAKPDAKNRAEVEKTIASLRPRCAPTVTAPTTATPAKVTTPTTASSTPSTSVPSSTQKPSGATNGARTAAGSRPQVAAPMVAVADTGANAAIRDDHRISSSAPHIDARSPFSATASVGVLLLDAGQVVMPAIGQLDVGARYRLLDRSITLEIGAGISLGRLPFDDVSMGAAWLVTPEIAAEAHYRVHSQISILGAAGVGPMLVSGLDAGNPFTEGGTASGTIAMVRVRGGIGVAWDATERIRVHATPSYLWSPRRDPLASDISALHGLALSAGMTVGW